MMAGVETPHTETVQVESEGQEGRDAPPDKAQKGTARARLPRVKRNNQYTGPFSLISSPIRQRIQMAFGQEPTGDLRYNPADWDVSGASKAADAVLEHFSTNVCSATIGLSHLRTSLSVLGCSEEVLQATARPDATKRANDIRADRQLERIAAGDDIPDVLARVGDLWERVREYLAGTVSIVSGQGAADLSLVLSARPGEIERLTIGPQGGITGMLKKKGAEGHYNLVSAVGVDEAFQMLTLWKAAPSSDRKRATRELEDLVRVWGITRSSLRGIGAFLAERSAVLTGQVRSAGQARSLKSKVLRHSKAQLQPVDFYSNGLETGMQLAATIAELSAEDRAEVGALVGRLKGVTIPAEQPEPRRSDKGPQAHEDKPMFNPAA